MGRRLACHRLTVALVAIAGTWLVILAAAPPAGALFGCGLNPACMFEKGVGGAVSSVAGDAITALARSVLQALGHAVEWSATLWTGVGTPQLADTNGQPVGAVAFVQQNLLYFTAGMAVASVLVGAAKIAIEEQKAYHARQLARFLVVYGMIAAGSAALGSALVYASDQMAADLISKATANTGFADHMAQLLGIAQAHGGGATGLAGLLAVAFAAIVLGIIAFLTTLLQILLMFVRNGMLVLLIGILPLAAAMSNTEVGMHWFKKAWAWLIAFALYKPAAAVVYAVAFVLPGQQGINALMSGIMMLVLAVLALPALLRFVVPATAAVAGGGGVGGLAAGAAGAMVGMRMPTGAAAVQVAGARSYETAAASSSSPGADGATGAAAAGTQGPPGLDGSSGSDGRRGGGGPAGAAGGAGAAGTGNGTAGEGGASGAPGAAGNDAGTGAGASTADAGGGTAGGSGGSGGGAGAGGGASGARGGVAGAAMYGAYEGAQAIKRAGEQQAGEDGPTGADGRRS